MDSHLTFHRLVIIPGTFPVAESTFTPTYKIQVHNSLLQHDFTAFFRKEIFTEVKNEQIKDKLFFVSKQFL
jgi:hypothetical protein